jgi:hypothetical protein
MQADTPTRSVRLTTIHRTPRHRRPTNIADDRMAVARLLAEHEPLPGNEAAAALGWSLERWWAAAGGYEWFVVTGKGWVLTPSARLEVCSMRVKAQASAN